MAIDVSIVICAHNSAGRLGATLGALAKQSASGIDWEILLIDNNSTDRTADVARELGKSLSLNLRVIPETLPGQSYARRRGVIESKARIVSFVDDDNHVDPDWVGQCVQFLEAHPQCGVMGGRIDPMFEDPASKPADFDERFAMALAIRDFGPRPIRLLPPENDPPCGAGMTGRRELFEDVMCKIGLFLSGRRGGRLTSGEDTEAGLVIQRLGWESWYNPALRMSHLLPAGRLTDDYLDRLIAGGARSTAWLNYLRGKEPRLTRMGYFQRYLGHQINAMKMSILHYLRPKGHAHSNRYVAWSIQSRGRAAGYLQLSLHDPAAQLDRKLSAVRPPLSTASPASITTTTI